MKTPETIFAWHVAMTGYHWVGDNMSEIDMHPPLDFYTPLAIYTALFKEFAALDPSSKADMLDFANNYGSLESRIEEPFELWSRAITDMRNAVAVWDAVQKKKRDWLKKHLKDASRESRRGYSTPSLNIQGGKEFLLEVVNKALMGQSSSVLHKNDSGELQLFNKPANLLGAMWLQLALAISGNKQYKPCANKKCSNQWDAESHNKNKTTCSDACKQAIYRKRSNKS